MECSWWKIWLFASQEASWAVYYNKSFFFFFFSFIFLLFPCVFLVVVVCLHYIISSIKHSGCEWNSKYSTWWVLVRPFWSDFGCRTSRHDNLRFKPSRARYGNWFLCFNSPLVMIMMTRIWLQHQPNVVYCNSTNLVGRVISLPFEKQDYGIPAWSNICCFLWFSNRRCSLTTSWGVVKNPK